MGRCPHCGGQALGCVGFNPNDPRREPWTGKWPGEADCERFGFFVTSDRSLPDINRLFAECIWNAANGNGGNNPPVGECETCIDGDYMICDARSFREWRDWAFPRMSPTRSSTIIPHADHAL